MTTPVVVIGDALLDVHAVPEATPTLGGDVPAAIRVLPGGQGANLAVRLARQGIDVSFVCALADDAAGRTVREALEREGIETQPLTAEATGTVVVIGGAAGERTMLSQRVPFAEQAAGAIRSGAEWIVLSGYLLLEPAAGRLVEAAVRTGARRVLVGCDVPARDRDAWRELALELAPTLVVLNRDEATWLALPESVAAVVTDARGATASVGGVTATAAVKSGTPAVDTTGAGDAFAAALLAGLAVTEWPPRPVALTAALERAVQLAARVAGVPGAQAKVEGEFGTLRP